jgi:hypothetical protein
MGVSRTLLHRIWEIETKNMKGDYLGAGHLKVKDFRHVSDVFS